MPLSLEPQYKERCCRRAFLYALVTAAIIFLPLVIWDKGYFFFFGDFNVQQIPFYKLAHEAIRTGDWRWNWYTDLGVNFIGSYSFYLIGSPFFWLTLPFPTEALPFLMAPLLVLKHACAAFTATLYCKRFVRNGNYAILAGLLYAFSGFAVYNIFFNHFHEAIVFFPLLLVGLEELIVNNRRGVFALAVAVNAFVNYWFFIGEVVFILLYFIVRACSPDWKITVKRFFWTAFESVVGLLLAMVLFLPSVMAIMGNPRTGMSELLNGWGLWVYWHNQLYPAIVSSAFFPPDLPSRPNLFPDRGAKWASLSAWLPLVSMCGVLAYLRAKRDWLRRILLICFLFALVPAFNSLFVLLNNSYYARWYYMPVLLMALASVRALETPAIHLRRGFQWTATLTMVITGIVAFTPQKFDDGSWKIGLMKYPEMFAATTGIALVSLGVFWFVWGKWRGKGEAVFTRVTTVAVCGVSAVYAIAFLGMGRAHSDDGDYLRQTALQGRYELELDDSVFARADIYDGIDNQGMFWHIPNIQTFHSIIPASIMEFYPKVGVKRDVSSKPETKYYQLRSLLSVRWLFVKEEEAEQELMPGYSLYATQLGHNIYENDHFIPMGFTYDYYITRSELEQVDKDRRATVMLRTLVLEDNDARQYTDLLEHMERTSYETMNGADYYADCENRRETAAYFFQPDNQGFAARIRLMRDNLVFFSVPYDKGWKATVNGRETQIVKSNIGFMAVAAPAGDCDIRFTYMPPGLTAGLGVTLFGAVLLAVYLLWFRLKKAERFVQFGGGYDADYEAQTGFPAPAEQQPTQAEETLEAEELERLERLLYEETGELLEDAAVQELPLQTETEEPVKEEEQDASE